MTDIWWRQSENAGTSGTTLILSTGRWSSEGRCGRMLQSRPVDQVIWCMFVATLLPLFIGRPSFYYFHYHSADEFPRSHRLLARLSSFTPQLRFISKGLYLNADSNWLISSISDTTPSRIGVTFSPKNLSNTTKKMAPQKSQLNATQMMLPKKSRLNSERSGAAKMSQLSMSVTLLKCAVKKI